MKKVFIIDGSYDNFMTEDEQNEMKNYHSKFLIESIPDIDIVFSCIDSYCRIDNDIVYYGWFGTCQGLFVVISNNINDEMYIRDFSFVKIFNKIDFLKWNKSDSTGKSWQRSKRLYSNYWRDVKYVDNLKEVSINNSEIVDLSKILEIPYYEGVYIITLKNMEQYIGRSKNLKARLLTHIKNYGISNILNIRIFRTKTHDDTKKLERKLINDNDPELNLNLKPNYIKI